MRARLRDPLPVWTISIPPDTTGLLAAVLARSIVSPGARSLIGAVLSGVQVKAGGTEYLFSGGTASVTILSGPSRAGCRG